MSAGDLVAIYAAVVSTCVLLWQIHAWRQSRGTRVEVTVWPGAMGGPEPQRLVFITVVNRSEHPIRVDGVGLYLQDGTRRQLPFLVQPLPNPDIPGVIGPRDSGSASLGVDLIEKNGVVLTEPVVAYATLSTTERITSRPTIVHGR